MTKKNSRKEQKKQQAMQEGSAGTPHDSREELAACTPISVTKDKFNAGAKIPYGLTIEHIYLSMSEFVNFLGFIN